MRKILFKNHIPRIFQILPTSAQISREYLVLCKKQLKTLFFLHPPKHWTEGTEGDVLLLPGFAENWIFLQTIANSFHSWGYKIHAIPSIGRNIYSLESTLQKVKDFIDQQQLENITLLSHSKGGIIAKLLVQDPDYAHRIKRSFSIASPYGGSVLARLRVLHLFDHHPNSPFTLKLQEMVAGNDKIINLYPKLDNHIVPNKHLILQGAKNICIDIVGHTRILEAKATIEAIKENLESSLK